MKPIARRPLKSDVLVDLAAVEVKLKDMILTNVVDGYTKDRLTTKVLGVIDDYLKTVAAGDRLMIRASLKALARKVFLQAKTLETLPKAPKDAIAAGDIRKEFAQVGATTVMIGDYQKRVKQVAAAIAEMQPEVTIGTKKISIRARAEIAVRNQAIKKDLDALREKGVNIIVVSTHANCSKRCQPWQGKYYSLDGTEGFTSDGKKYIALATAIAGENDDNNGLFGINCRHRAYEYKPGMATPVEFTEAEINAQRAVDDKMRKAERRLKDMWQIYKIAPDPTTRRDAKKLFDDNYEKYLAFARLNNRAVEDWRIKT